MKKRLFLLALLLGAASLFAEPISIDANLTGWKKQHGKGMCADKAVKVGETPSIRLSGVSQLIKVLQLKANTQYRVSFKMKGKSIPTNGGAVVVVNGGTKWIAMNEGGEENTGTFDWTPEGGTFSTADTGTDVTLYLMLKAGGTAWFDQLDVSEVKPGAPVATHNGELPIKSSMAGWKKNDKNSAVDKKVTVSGTGSIRLADNSQVFRILQLKENTKYRVKFFVKAENVPEDGKHGASVLIHGTPNGTQKWMRVPSGAQDVPDAGTFDWKKGEGVIDTAVVGTKIEFYLMLNTTGTVWYDKVSVTEDGSSSAAGAPTAAKKAWSADLFPVVHMDGKEMTFCEKFPTPMHLFTDGKVAKTDQLKLIVEAPEYFAVSAVEVFPLSENTHRALPVTTKNATRNGVKVKRYEFSLYPEAAEFFGQRWFEQVLFIEPQSGTNGKSGQIFWSFSVNGESHMEKSFAFRVLPPVKLPARPCRRFGTMLFRSLPLVTVPDKPIGRKSLQYWNALTTNKLMVAAFPRESRTVPGFKVAVAAMKDDFRLQAGAKFYNEMRKKMPQTVKDDGGKRDTAAIWSLVDDKDGIWEAFVRESVRAAKAAHPDLSVIIWDFEPHPYGYDDAGRARFAKAIGLTRTPSREEINSRYADQWFQYMVKLHADFIAKGTKIIQSELPGMEVWLCSDNLVAKAPHVNGWCGVDVRLSDKVVDVHNHMPYYCGTKYFDDVAFNTANLKKPFFPLIDPAEKSKMFFTRYTAPEITQDIVATAALGGVGLGFWPDDAFTGEYVQAIADGFGIVAQNEDFYMDGTRCEKSFQVAPKNAVVRTLPDGRKISFPDFSSTLRYTVHELNGKYLATVFNYDRTQPILAEISGKGVTPFFVKVPALGCVAVRADAAPDQAALKREAAQYSSDSPVFRDFSEGKLAAKWSAASNGTPLLMLSDGKMSAGVDLFRSGSVLSLTNAADAEFLSDGNAGNIMFADKLQPALCFEYVKHGIEAGVPFVTMRAVVAPYDGANPDPNPLQKMEITRKYSVKNGVLRVETSFHNPTAQAMPLDCRLQTYPWLGKRLGANRIALNGADAAGEIWKVEAWKKPVQLQAESDGIRESMTITPESAFDGMYSWYQTGNTPRRTVELLVKKPLAPGATANYVYLIQLQ